MAKLPAGARILVTAKLDMQDRKRYFVELLEGNDTLGPMVEISNQNDRDQVIEAIQKIAAIPQVTHGKTTVDVDLDTMAFWTTYYLDIPKL